MEHRLRNSSEWRQVNTELGRLACSTVCGAFAPAADYISATILETQSRCPHVGCAGGEDPFRGVQLPPGKRTRGSSDYRCASTLASPAVVQQQGEATEHRRTLSYTGLHSLTLLERHYEALTYSILLSGAMVENTLPTNRP